LIRRAPCMKKDELVILNLSGRGDKDMEILSRYV
jgi:tryptophan synthase beta subunit